MMAFGVGIRKSFDLLLQPVWVRPVWVADFQHIPYIYLRKHYGTKIHRDMIRLWAGVDETHVKDRLLGEGFSIDEIPAILYSYLAKQNLAWLFQPSPDISEERIAQALTILQELIVSFIVIDRFVVMDRQGRPLDGARLSIEPPSGVEISYVSGGVFRLRLPASGTYRLRAEWTSPYGTTAKEFIDGTPAELQSKNSITLPVEDITIKTVDLDGRPVADAFVRFAGKDVGSTDSQGIIIVRQVPLDHSYVIIVTKEGIEIGSDRVQFTTSRTSATIQAGIYDVTVLVKGAAGQPIQGALVELIRGGTTIARTRTDDGGRAVFSRVVGSDYIVKATYEQFSSTASLPKGMRNAVVTLDIKTARLPEETRGTVVTPEKQGIEQSAETIIMGAAIGAALLLTIVFMVSRFRAGRRRRKPVLISVEGS